MANKTVLAVDLGAESGRVMAVHFDGASFTLEELIRFPNTPVKVRNTLHWNVLSLWRDIIAGIEAGMHLQPVSIGVDTWGVDFALLDAQGQLLGLPVHYRDARTNNIAHGVFERVPWADVFAQTGIQLMQINTLYQLISMVEQRSPVLQVADTFLTIPDLINYWLTGEKVCEYTNATTTQMVDTKERIWAFDLLRSLDVPTYFLPDIVEAGTRLGVFQGISVIAPACHDTGSAVAAVPAIGKNFGYISSGTWSLVGLETPAPIINSQTREANLTNEGGIFGTNRLLKNVMGLWIIQQCRATWAAQGQLYSYAELTTLAENSKPFLAVIDVNDARFLSPGDHTLRVQDYCRETEQSMPEAPGEVARVVLESLALAYRKVLDGLIDVSGQKVEQIHIIGGGSQNALLNQMTADATNIPVQAGPVEATILGNALVQLISLGELGSIEQGRQIIVQSNSMLRYEPQHTEEWRSAFERYKSL